LMSHPWLNIEDQEINMDEVDWMILHICTNVQDINFGLLFIMFIYYNMVNKVWKVIKNQKNIVSFIVYIK
jgi:hypothetical protein